MIMLLLTPGNSRNDGIEDYKVKEDKYECLLDSDRERFKT